MNWHLERYLSSHPAFFRRRPTARAFGSEINGGNCIYFWFWRNGSHSAPDRLTAISSPRQNFTRVNKATAFERGAMAFNDAKGCVTADDRRR